MLGEVNILCGGKRQDQFFISHESMENDRICQQKFAALKTRMIKTNGPGKVLKKFAITKVLVYCLFKVMYYLCCK